MVTKEKLREVAKTGNQFYSNGEYRCSLCGKHDFSAKHEADCPMGALLQMIEDSDLE